MSPKSRLYSLVMAWKNKPFLGVSEARPDSWIEKTDSQFNQSDSKSNKISKCVFEPIFTTPGEKLFAAIFRPLQNAQLSQVLRQCMEGLDSVHYWQASNRRTPILLPLQKESLEDQAQIDGLCDLILNSRLPVGLVMVGISANGIEAFNRHCQESLLRLRRLGVLLHLLHCSGEDNEIAWVDDFHFEGVHLSANQLRDLAPAIQKQQIHSFQKMGIKIYLSEVTFISDLDLAKKYRIEYAYGGLMMPPVSRHQISQINDSRIGKALFMMQGEAE
jgi:EAL domain-containing protein (putative c-di-GMP-specific phosphodiesterase class I)